MNFFSDIVGNVVSAGQGFWDGLTGASRRKKEEAKRRQKASQRVRREAQSKAQTAQNNVQRLVGKAREIDQRQDSLINAARQLATRSMSTAKAAVFQSEQLRDLVSGIRKDFKVLAAQSASAQSLAKTNELVAELGEELKQMGEADKAYKEATDQALEALNEEAANTTEHLNLLTQARQEKDGWQTAAADVLPWARVAVSALNLEQPKNEVFYYAYLASGPFLRERLDPVMAELITTGLQILAYWDEEGLQGLFRSRKDGERLQTVLNQTAARDKELDAFFARSDVRKLLTDAGIQAPR